MEEKKSVPNPHDAYFRRTFGRAEIAAEFLRLYLPPEVVELLDLRRVTLVGASFVDEKLHEHRSDLLYRVGLKAGGEAFVYILLEHKSAPDERVMLQLLRYMVQSWDRSPAPLPLIIPVVIYHGVRPRRVGSKLSELFGLAASTPVWRRYLPDFEYYLCDLSRYRDEDLQGESGLAAMLKMLKYALRRDLWDKLPEIFDEVVATLPEPQAWEQVKTIVSYVTEARHATGEMIHEAMLASSGGHMETIIDKWEREAQERGISEGLRRGERKGLAQGRQLGAVELILTQLRQQIGKLERAAIAAIRALSLTEVKQLSKAAFQFRSHADLDKWLQAHTAAASATAKAASVPAQRPSRKVKSKN